MEVTDGQSSLSSVERLELVKYFFTGVIVCGLVFIAPAVVLSYWLPIFSRSGSSLLKTVVGWGFIAFIILLLVTHSDDVYFSIQSFIGNVRKQFFTGKSLPVGLFWASFLLVYFLAFVYVPLPAIIFSGLIMIPAGFTYDKYKKICELKKVNR